MPALKRLGLLGLEKRIAYRLEIEHAVGIGEVSPRTKTGLRKNSPTRRDLKENTAAGRVPLSFQETEPFQRMSTDNIREFRTLELKPNLYPALAYSDEDGE